MTGMEALRLRPGTGFTGWQGAGCGRDARAPSMGPRPVSGYGAGSSRGWGMRVVSGDDKEGHCKLFSEE